jgi:histidine triad (HIT) family protein
MEANCVFCKIVAGEIPSHKVYEDADYLAFLDIHPQSPGHMQVIPKKHYRFVWDLPARSTATQGGVPNFTDYFSVVHKLANAIKGTFGTDFVFSRVMGDEVLHAHVWLFPHPKEAKGDPQDFAGNAEKIRKVIDV